VFGKVESERMPMRKVWDHAIDLKETFKLRKGRIYPLSKNEREEVQNFVEDQLRKEYIRPSKSPQMSPVFFVGKKDGSKRMVMDYHNLNDQMIKNNYPLLLITELIDNMGSKTVFMKMDLRWGFNNVRIKEGDEWKGAFTMHIGSFEPTVMFFGIEMEAEKVDGVLSWPQPKNVKDIRKFLGLANYYRRFIKDFARVARPMNVLTWKDEKW